MNNKNDDVNTITPGIGLGSLRFGMSPAQVAEFLGVPQKIDPIWDSSGFKEFRDLNSPIVSYDNDEKLTDIGVDHEMANVFFNECNIFATDPETIIRMLWEANGKVVYYGLGTFMFWNLGITCGGYYNSETRQFYTLKEYLETEQDDRTLTLWPIHDRRWEDLRSEFSEFDLPQ